MKGEEEEKERKTKEEDERAERGGQRNRDGCGAEHGDAFTSGLK